MINNVFLIGSIKEMPQAYDLDNKKKDYYFLLETKRPFSSDTHSRESDYVTCKIWSGSAHLIEDNCQIGSYLCVKGRLMNAKNEFDLMHHPISIVCVEDIQILDRLLVKK